MDQVGALEVKIRVEREEPHDEIPAVLPAEEPDYEDDWLLDIRLYSRSFRADRASILLQDLGLTNQHLRSHLADRRKFFDNKDRLQKLKGLVAPDDTAADLDRKMIAVVTKADQPEFFNILRTVFHAWTEAGDDIDLDDPPAVWEQIEKFDLDESVLADGQDAVRLRRGAPNAEELPDSAVGDRLRPPLEGGRAPGASRSACCPQAGASNAVVCLAQWRDSSSKGSSYDRLSEHGAAILKIEDHLPDLEIDAPDRRDDVPGGREGDRQQLAGSGADDGRHRSTPRTSGRSPPGDRLDIGLR